MKDRYVIVNEEERDEFEKENEMPYGYYSCEIFYDFYEAVDHFHLNYGEGWIVEKFDSEGREKVYEWTKKC